MMKIMCIDEGPGACTERVFWAGVVLLTSPESTHPDLTVSLADPSVVWILIQAFMNHVRLMGPGTLYIAER